jgi:hypothetical protein
LKRCLKDIGSQIFAKNTHQVVLEVLVFFSSWSKTDFVFTIQGTFKFVGSIGKECLTVLHQNVDEVVVRVQKGSHFEGFE